MGKLTSTIGIPIKLLNEAQVRRDSCISAGALLESPIARETAVEEAWWGAGARPLTLSLQGHVVTLEITSGVVYRGKLLEGVCSPCYSCSFDLCSALKALQ